MFDYLIQNGTLIDGTGAPAAVGDVAIKDGKSPQSAISRMLLPGQSLTQQGRMLRPALSTFTATPTRRSSARISASWSSSRA